MTTIGRDKRGPKFTTNTHNEWNGLANPKIMRCFLFIIFGNTRHSLDCYLYLFILSWEMTKSSRNHQRTNGYHSRDCRCFCAQNARTNFACGRFHWKRFIPSSNMWMGTHIVRMNRFVIEAVVTYHLFQLATFVISPSLTEMGLWERSDSYSSVMLTDVFQLEIRAAHKWHALCEDTSGEIFLNRQSYAKCK